MDMVMRRMATLPTLAREPPSGWRWMTEGAQQRQRDTDGDGSRCLRSMSERSTGTEHGSRTRLPTGGGGLRRRFVPASLPLSRHTRSGREAEFSSWSSLSWCSAYEREDDEEDWYGDDYEEDEDEEDEAPLSFPSKSTTNTRTSILAPRRRFAVQPMDPWPVRQLDPRSSRPVDQPRPLLRGVRLNTPTHRTGLR